MEGSLDRRKGKGKPELVLSELDRLHPISAACLQTSATQSACLTIPWPDAWLISRHQPSKAVTALSLQACRLDFRVMHVPADERRRCDTRASCAVT